MPLVLEFDSSMRASSRVAAETQQEVGVPSAVRTSSLRLVTAAAAVLAVLVVASPAAAVPTAVELRLKQQQAAEARVELERMNEELEVAVEGYNAITEALAQTRSQIATTEAELERAEADLARSQRLLEERVAAMYRGEDAGFIEVLFGASSFEDLIVRIEFLTRIGRHDAQLVREASAARRRVESVQRALQNREEEQAALRAKAERQAADIRAAIERQKSYVASLDAEIKRLIAEEEERQRRLAEERAKRAAAAAAARRGRPATPAGDLPPGHPEVVDIALKYLGVPYVWGGASPEGFDCSGLCQYVYAQIGISLPRTSAAQYRAGAHIPPDRLDLLRPGDLVFFGTDGDPSRVHHVGIYVGDGDYVHAPQLGDVVKVSSLTMRIQSRGDYVGASRF